jgi:hypothetical protein
VNSFCPTLPFSTCTVGPGQTLVTGWVG